MDYSDWEFPVFEWDDDSDYDEWDYPDAYYYGDV